MGAIPKETHNFQLKVLLLGVFLSHLGTFMVLPILPIFLKVQKGMGISEIGIILAVSPFMFQAGSLLGGVLADRIGRRAVIALGAFIYGIALCGYTISNTFWLFILIGILSGFGLGLNAPSTKAALSVLASSNENKTTAFSLRGIAANGGIAIAGLLTYFILGGASGIVFLVAGGLYFLLGVISWIFLPKGCGDAPCKPIPLKDYLIIFKNKAFVVFSLFTIFVWAIYTQLSISLPLRAEAILEDPGMVSLIWTINSGIVILLQASVTRFIIKKIHPVYVIAIGTLFIGAGLGSIYWSTNFYWFILSGTIFVIGEMLILPTMDITVSRLGTAKMIGVFFGLTNFVSGLGEASGKFAGGQLLSNGTSSPTPWMVYVVTAVIISIAFFALRFWKPLRIALEEMPSLNQINKSNKGPFSIIDWIFGKKRRFE